MNHTSFKVNIENHIAEVSINRPEKANSLNMAAWEEMRSIFNATP